MIQSRAGRLAVIVNVSARLRRRSPKSSDLRPILGEQGTVFETRSLDDLDRLANDLARGAQPGLVVLWGGDGTITRSVTALVSAWKAEGAGPLPPLAVLPAGTVNAIASSLGIRGPPSALLSKMVRARRAGEALPHTERTLIQACHQYGFLFGIGIIPNALGVYESGRTVGALRALQVFVNASKSLLTDAEDEIFSTFSARVRVDGEPLAERALTNISAGTVRSLPFRFAPYLRAAEQLGAFHLIVHDLRARGALRALVEMRRGFGMARLAGVEERVARRAEIELSRSMPWALDGEIFEPRSTLTLSGGPVITIALPHLLR